MSDSKDSFVFSDAGPFVFVSEHDSIMQTLNRKAQGNKPIYLSLESFKGTEDKWPNVPIIYAQTHPDLDAWDQNPEAELARIKGRLVVGKLEEASIASTGHPRLMGKWAFADPEIQKGIADGTISLSTGFRCTNDGVKLTGQVQPHHLLLFKETEKHIPGDLSTGFLNQQNTSAGDEKLTEDELKAKLAVAEDGLKKSNDAFTNLQKKYDDDIKAKDKEIADLKAENLTFQKQVADQKWDSFKSRRIPKGLLKDEAAEKAARQEFENDPITFMEKLMDTPAPKTGDGAEPQEFTHGPKAPAKKKFEDELNDVNVPSVMFSKGMLESE